MFDNNKKLSPLRKELWDYFQECGIQITVAQHNRIKKIWENYIEIASGIHKELYEKNLAEVNIARHGFKEWRRIKNEKQRANIETRTLKQITPIKE